MRDTLSGDRTFHELTFTQLLVVTSGRARLRGPFGEESLVGAGSVLLLHPGETLTLRSPEELKLTRLDFDAERLLPSRSAFEPLGSVDNALRGQAARGPALLGLSPRHAGRVSDALGRIEAELCEPRLGHELLLRAQLLELIVVLARAEHAPEGDPLRHRPRLELTLKLIHERYSEQLSLAALARHAGMSISRFSCVFREALGTSPLEYVAATRMREARQRLRAPGLSIAEVAYAVGFQDSNYFSRSFKQHHGMSPREFRDMARIAG
ncbi:MAG: AraC family transcriptional regulator [Myxococcales bacterium]|nr:MAG: AraC family transcriptional regulator [Myxococcales bacterium]